MINGAYVNQITYGTDSMSVKLKVIHVKVNTLLNLKDSNAKIIVK